MNTIIHSIEFVKHKNGIIYPKDDTMFVQTTIAGESFDRMLIDNENVINIFFGKMSYQVQTNYLWISMLEPHNLIGGGQVPRRQTTLLGKLGKKP